jgi:hypothetical protein
MDAWLAADRRRPGDPALARVATSMAALEAAHRRWKGTHLTVATRMLGSARGSGYTSGVPYLQSWVEHRLFGECPAIRAADVPDRTCGHHCDGAAEIPVPRTGEEPPVDVAAGQSLSRPSRQ